MKLSELTGTAESKKLSDITGDKKPFRPTGPVPGDSDYEAPKESPKPETMLGRAADYVLTQGHTVDPDTAKGQLGRDALTALESTAGMTPGGSLIRGAKEAAPSVLEKVLRTDQFEHAVAAREAGYVLPPAMGSAKPSKLAQILTGWGGKIKTQQAASQANQEVTNRLAAKSLGLSEDAPLTEKAFADIRKEAGAVYEELRNAYHTMTTDGVFKKAIADLGGANSQAAKEFPALMKNKAIEQARKALGSVDRFSTQAGVEIVKKLRYMASQNLKAIGDPEKHAVGLAQREAADAIDDLFERNLADLNYSWLDQGPTLVDKYRKARQLIARSYDVEGATNAATGDVSARGLAKLADKGRPLGDELQTIADAAKAFPKALQDMSSVGGNEAFSALDFFGASGAAAAGHPSVAGSILLRPAARGAILSKPAQDAMIGAPKARGMVPSGPGYVSNLVSGITANELQPDQSK